MPDKAYLNIKRTSVFHKAFESKDHMENWKAPIYEKTQEEIKSLTELFNTSFLTKNIDAGQHNVLANAMQKKKIKSGEIIIRYGDLGQEYYVLFQGTCQVSVYKAGANPNDPNLEEMINFKKTLKTDLEAKPPLPMIGFGEIALLYNDKRTASVTAQTDCEAWVLSGDVFKHIIA